MAAVKYQVKEFTPSGNQQGEHSFYAAAVINQILSNTDIAKKIAARTGFKSYEIKAVLAGFVDVASEELQEGNALQLSDDNNQTMVKFLPKVEGSVSDSLIKKETTAAHAQDSTVAVRTVAEESDLTSDRLHWTVAAQVGINFSDAFAKAKTAQKVKVTSTATTTSESGGTPSDDNNDIEGLDRKSTQTLPGEELQPLFLGGHFILTTKQLNILPCGKAKQ